MFPLLPITLKDEPVAEKVTAAPDLTPIVTTVAAPTSLPSDFLKLVAVHIPVTTNPFSTFTALFASLPTNLSTLIRPSAPPPNVPSGLKPKTSGIKSSPSDIIKSAPLPTLISAY